MKKECECTRSKDRTEEEKKEKDYPNFYQYYDNYSSEYEEKINGII